MTPGGCAISNEGDTKQLIDKRDGKTYWVAKLADGNCWMTQNLELDLSISTPLTSELSDVTSSWTPTNTYTSAQSGRTSNSAVQSWNLGKYVWKTPDSSGDCYPETDFSESSCSPYWQDVSNWTTMTEYRTDGVAYDSITQTYDAHYLAGNYYSWRAATAGTAPSGSGTASDSICPKGFELPISGSNGNGSFYYLLNQYGLAGSPTSGNNDIVKAPLFFVRSGYVYPNYHYLNYAGYGGYYWSSVASSSSLAHSLYFYPSYVGPSLGNGRYVGFSVRCVALSN